MTYCLGRWLSLSRSFKGMIFVFLSAFGFGVMPIFAKYAYLENVGVTTLLFLRFVLATLIFFSYVFIKIRKIDITKKQLLALFALGGIGYTLQSTFYFSAVKYIPATMVALLLYTYPIFVAILSFFVDKEKITGKILAAIALSFFGLMLVLGTSFGQINFLGVIFAIGAGFVYSCYIILGNRVLHNLSPMLTSAFVALFASFSFFTVGSFTGNLNFHFAGIAWLPILGIVLFSTVLAMFTFFKGLELLGSTKASILSMIEPLITCVFSTWLFNEKLTVYQLFGGLIVILGAMLVVSAREHNKSNEAIAAKKELAG